MDPVPPVQQRIAAVAALDQPLRRRLHRLLADAEGWLTRDDAAGALDVPRSVAAFHLDKLAEAGVVDVRFERTTGRSGPGAGRPSKLYRLAADEVSASVPQRHYDLAGSLLAAAVSHAAATGAPVAECVRQTARDAGRGAGAEAAARAGGTTRPQLRAALTELLERYGYEPVSERRREIVLDNCPFHRLAAEHRELVCGMNLDFLTGVIEGLGGDSMLSARLEPAPGHCCVRIAAA